MTTPPVAKGRSFKGDDRLRGEVIERLMCDGRVDADALGAKYGAPSGWWRDADSALAEMQADGLLTLQDGQIRMTQKGRPLVRIAAAAFDAYLPHSTARHSASV